MDEVFQQVKWNRSLLCVQNALEVLRHLSLSNKYLFLLLKAICFLSPGTTRKDKMFRLGRNLVRLLGMGVLFVMGYSEMICTV